MAPLTTLQPSASLRVRQPQVTKPKQPAINQDTVTKKPAVSRGPTSAKPRRLPIQEDKENTPPQRRHSNGEKSEDLNTSNLRRSITYSKLNHSFSPSPSQISKNSNSNSRRGSEDDNKRTSLESILSVYEDCKTGSRRQSLESVVSVYEDARTPPGDNEDLNVDILPPLSEENLAKKCDDNRRLSKESTISVYEDCSEYLISSPESQSDQYEDSLMLAPGDNLKTPVAVPGTPGSGYNSGILVESYEIVEEVTEEIVTEEVKVTETRILSDSYEINRDVDVEVISNVDRMQHEQVTKETFVHLQPERDSPMFYGTPGTNEKRFFPPLGNECQDGVDFSRQTMVITKSEEIQDVLDIRRETVVIDGKGKSKTLPQYHFHGETCESGFNMDIRRETVVVGKGPQCPDYKDSRVVLNHQSPTRYQFPGHLTGERGGSFSPVQHQFSPQSPGSDPNADLETSRRDTVTKDCPSPALVACHSRMVRAGRIGCVDDVDSLTSTPLVNIIKRQLSHSPKSSTPIPGRMPRKGSGAERKPSGPSWAQPHLAEPVCSPVSAPLLGTSPSSPKSHPVLDTSPVSPKRKLFSRISDPDARRISTLTVTKSKPSVTDDFSPSSVRSENSPVINPVTVTKSRPSIHGHLSQPIEPGHFERTVDQSTFSNHGAVSIVEPIVDYQFVKESYQSKAAVQDSPSSIGDGLRLSDLDSRPARVRSLTGTMPHPSVESIPEEPASIPVWAQADYESSPVGINVSDNIFAEVDPDQASTSLNKSINSRTRSGKKKRRSSGRHRRSGSGQASRRISSQTVTKSRSSFSQDTISSANRKRLSSKQLFSPSQKTDDLVDSVKPFSPSPPSHIMTETGFAKQAARMRQDLDNSLQFPILESNVTSSLVNKSRMSQFMEMPTKAAKPAKRRSFGNKTLPTNANRPVMARSSKVQSSSLCVQPEDSSCTLKLTRTQQLRRNGKMRRRKGGGVGVFSENFVQNTPFLLHFLHKIWDSEG